MNRLIDTHLLIHSEPNLLAECFQGHSNAKRFTATSIFAYKKQRDMQIAYSDRNMTKASLPGALAALSTAAQSPDLKRKITHKNVEVATTGREQQWQQKLNGAQRAAAEGKISGNEQKRGRNKERKQEGESMFGYNCHISHD
jgi:hypothetical protein